MARVLSAVVVVTMAFGLVAEVLSSAWPEAAALADLGAGWVLALSGFVGWRRRPKSLVGPLLVVAAFAWFAGTLAASAITPLATIGGALVTIHRGPILHAIVGYPTGRVPGAARLVVISGYAYAAVAPLARNDVATLLIAAIVVTATVWLYQRSTGPQRQARLMSVVAAAIVSVGLLVGSVGRIVHAGADVESVASWIYFVCIALVAVLLAADLARARWARAELEQLVVDLGEPHSSGVRGRLAATLGDPSLEVVYWVPESGGYADERGRPIALPEATSGRTVTLLEQQGMPIGALIHDPATLEDAALLGGVAAAARIAVANVRLEAQIRRHLADLEASRRRIVEATDAERRRLQTLVGLRVGRELSGVRALLQRGYDVAQASANEAAAAALKAAGEGLEAAEQDVARLAAGLHPIGLAEHGIGPSLSALVERVGVPVRMAVPSVRLAPEVETTVVFVCSEALTNVRKYANASRAAVDVHVDGRTLVVTVTDDGVGGADPSSRSGLNGLRDRVEAIGGTLSIDSPPGAGTRITTRIPVDASTGLADAMPGLHDERARLAHPP